MAQSEERSLQSLRIRLYGIVQGVGFRPFVARLAFEYGVTGIVKNSGGSVEILASGDNDTLDAFLKAILAKKPALAEIVYFKTEALPYAVFPSFTIEQSSNSKGRIFFSADLPVCENCLQELSDRGDRRFCHPFISCMSCGPRYSVIECAPYDRDTTTMRDFPMCEACTAEYKNREDRRYHAQTISCHDCGPVLLYRNRDGMKKNRQDAFLSAVRALKSGGIVAIKGIGGYHLACLPTDEKAVQNLRLLKRRELKPFAVMFLDLKSLSEYCLASLQEHKLLQSSARPIVLLRKGNKALAPSVCRSSRYVGAFLPYTPLQFMLLSECGPLVMTSANISDDPIIKDDEAMFAFSNSLLDGILYNERRIAVRLDDSVLKVVEGRDQMIRRSRGFVPLPVVIRGTEGNDSCIFAAGGQLKSTFCFFQAPFAYLCEHMGDLDGEHNGAVYAENFSRFQELFEFKPSLAVCDMHPAYASTAFLESLSLPVLQVQHHHAHIASVMAEHGLLGPVIGIAFDGTGYGTDKAVWGGEFLFCEGSSFTRVGHLKYASMLGGDEIQKDAIKSAICRLYAAGLEEEIEDERWELIKAALQKGGLAHQSSSMGRLFDAVSAYLGICAYNRIEAECAMELENLAAEALALQISPIPMMFEIFEENGCLIADDGPLWAVLQKHKQSDKRALALGFHKAVASMLTSMCEQISTRTGSKTVALSGGVFQNTVLYSLTIRKLEQRGFMVYSNEKVPPNDGGICLGQAYIGSMRQRGL